ncbi:EscU/YscU/HrcU family type III secretion system export apparatus switch protein [Yoonia sp. 208BN28-4]|uniref:EscU/YscU/HrcU family type III secretion system export apparatus switch protein n=1 Tax=Yoonia sp. 208BN28-4 TaxID=3126505 RepID=UPI0030A7C93B
MSGENAEDDKQFDPTPKKLEDARRKGEVVKSTDLMTAASYAGFIAIAWFLGAGSLISVGGTLSDPLRQAATLSQVMFDGGPAPIFGVIIIAIMRDVAPWFLAPAVAVLLCIIAKRSFAVAPSKLQPKLNRISLISGAKNKFGRQGFFEFAKSAIKLTIYSCILGIFLVAQSETIIAVIQQSPQRVAILLVELVLRLLVIVLCVATALGMIDYVWQAAEHKRKNRMSRKEIMDEMKNAEGDPMMKQSRRQKAMSLANNKMLTEVPKADVVIVNPTHFAVALRWDPGTDVAPVCIAKGVDEIAARIREVAAENTIPIYSDPPTARALYAEVDLDQPILPVHFQAVAAAIRFAEAMRSKAR